MVNVRAWVLVLVATSSVAVADSGAESPWAKGVSAERQDAARRLLDEGNELFIRKQYREALAVYESALAEWDHPAIRFNVVRTRLALDQPVEAQEDLERALAFGAEPLGDAMYAEALNYRGLLRASVGEVSIRCDVGTTVTWNGEPVACPLTERRVRPGRYAIAASRPGFVAQARSETVMPGPNPDISVRLVSIADATVTRTRWAVWKPWALTGVGATMLGLGALLELNARGVHQQYRDAVSAACGTTSCPSLDGPTQALHDSWVARDRWAVATMVTGALVLAAGVSLVVVNRPYTETHESVTTAIVPLPGGAVLSAAARF